MHFREIMRRISVGLFLYVFIFVMLNYTFGLYEENTAAGAKFGKKILYVNYLHELGGHVNLNQLSIPEAVKDHDVFLLAKNQPEIHPTSIITAPLETQQFGVSIDFMKSRNNNQTVPRVVEDCVSYLEKVGLETEGLFRRSINATVVRRVQKMFNEGKHVNFELYGGSHVAAVLLKSFLRELPEPILTFELYDYAVRIPSLDRQEQISETRRILIDELPRDNYIVLDRIIGLLVKVVAKADLNLMSLKNISIVFGPNVAWSKNQLTLTTIAQVNSFTELLISEYSQLFTVQS